MGFRKIQTYILESEHGASLKATGWISEGLAGELKWKGNKNKRQQFRDRFEQMEMFPTKRPPEEMKTRWAKYFNNGGTK